MKSQGDKKKKKQWWQVKIMRYSIQTFFKRESRFRVCKSLYFDFVSQFWHHFDLPWVFLCLSFLTFDLFFYIHLTHEHTHANSYVAVWSDLWQWRLTLCRKQVGNRHLWGQTNGQMASGDTMELTLLLCINYFLSCSQMCNFCHVCPACQTLCQPGESMQSCHSEKNHIRKRTFSCS